MSAIMYDVSDACVESTLSHRLIVAVFIYRRRVHGVFIYWRRLRRVVD